MTPQALLAQHDVSRETTARLDAYAALLTKWNATINLVAKSTLTAIWDRHFLDSAQIFDLCPPNATHWADLGSGGGFPGLVVAILAAEKRPDLNVTLVESDLRKATFLRTAARELGLGVRIESLRCEDLAPLGADVVSARALAPLKTLLLYAERHLAKDGLCLFLKGANAAQEIADALAVWRFDVHKTPSRTDPDAMVLSIRGIARARP